MYDANAASSGSPSENVTRWCDCALGTTPLRLILVQFAEMLGEAVVTGVW